MPPTPVLAVVDEEVDEVEDAGAPPAPLPVDVVV
jgi:hypothetical protein